MKKILIIGATSAIAKEVARIYATKESEIVIWGRNKESLGIIREDLTARGAKIPLVISHDLNDFLSHPQEIENAWAALKSVDIVLLAHGSLGDQAKAEKDQREFFNIFESNFLSHASLINIISQKMLQQGRGHICVISSVAGDRGKQSNYIYGAASAAKSIYTDGLRNRLFQHGIHVMTVKLGFVDTPMTKEFKKGLLWAQSEQVAQSIVRAIELRKNSIYLPFFWRWIMLIIKNIPEWIFVKMKL